MDNTQPALMQPKIQPAAVFTPMMRKSAVVILILLTIAGSIYLIKTKPKAAIYIGGGIVLLFIWAYFFLAMWGPSRYEQWKSRNSDTQPKTAVGPQPILPKA